MIRVIDILITILYFVCWCTTKIFTIKSRFTRNYPVTSTLLLLPCYFYSNARLHLGFHSYRIEDRNKMTQINYNQVYMPQRYINKYNHDDIYNEIYHYIKSLKDTLFLYTISINNVILILKGVTLVICQISYSFLYSSVSFPWTSWSSSCLYIYLFIKVT